MNNIKIKRLIAYIIELLFIIFLYTSIFFIFNKVVFYSIHTFLTKFSPVLNNISTFINENNLSYESVINTIQTSDISTLIQTYDLVPDSVNSFVSTSLNSLSLYFLILLAIYSFVFFILLPYIIKFILYLVGDLGKKTMKLTVVRNGKKVRNKTSLESSPALITFKLYYSIILFIFVSRPVYTFLIKAHLDDIFTNTIKAFYFIGLIQMLYFTFKILLYFYNFLISNYTWREKFQLEVTDNLDEYIVKYNKTHVQFPLFYEEMMNFDYTPKDYFLIERKSKRIPRLFEFLTYIEEKEMKNSSFIRNNFTQIKEIIKVNDKH